MIPFTKIKSYINFTLRFDQESKLVRKGDLQMLCPCRQTVVYIKKILHKYSILGLVNWFHHLIFEVDLN